MAGLIISIVSFSLVIIFGFFMSVFSFIVFLIQKSVYKKIMKAIWEVKNVL